MHKYEATRRFTVLIQGVGTVSVSACDRFHAIDKAYTENMHKESDRRKYDTVRKRR